MRAGAQFGQDTKVAPGVQFARTGYKQMKKQIEHQQKLSHLHQLHPAWLALIKHCQEIGFGEIERIKIQSGLPVLVEKTTQRIKLT